MAETIIGSNITIEGDISGSDPLTLHGTLKGSLQVDDVVTIATNGLAEADIESAAIEVAGVVEGNVTASDKIDIKAGGRLVGDVRAPRVLIADGAAFKGNINMQD
ncbi:MAG: polymer-forming cytoskeletal protein [Myxococcota bacterium]|nr:polymer-forming cytoskeletal protein [Myxococcota bacterium]